MNVGFVEDDGFADRASLWRRVNFNKQRSSFGVLNQG